MINIYKKYISRAIFFILLVAPIVLFAEGQITGYYYDPNIGKIVTKIDNLGPQESESYENTAISGEEPNSTDQGNDNTKGKSADAPGQNKDNPNKGKNK